jgi:hypothetical protein
MLGYALKNLKFRQAIEQAESREKILEALRQVKKGMGQTVTENSA